MTTENGHYFRDRILEKELSNKSIREILNILEDGHVGYIAEPPCSLSDIFILPRSKWVMVDLQIENIPINIRENTITCN